MKCYHLLKIISSHSLALPSAPLPSPWSHGEKQSLPSHLELWHFHRVPCLLLWCQLWPPGNTSTVELTTQAGMLWHTYPDNWITSSAVMSLSPSQLLSLSVYITLGEVMWSIVLMFVCVHEYICTTTCVYCASGTCFLALQLSKTDLAVDSCSQGKRVREDHWQHT